MKEQIEISIDVIIHATEDIEKFYTSFEEIFKLDKEEFTIQNLTGHFDNPIVLLSAKISKKIASGFLKNLISNLTKSELNYLVENIEEFIADSALHLRIDKQEFVKGSIHLEDKNAIKIRIYIPVYKKKEIVESYTNLIKNSN